MVLTMLSRLLEKGMSTNQWVVFVGKLINKSF